MSSISSKCQEGITASLDDLTYINGRLVIPPETTLFELLSQCFTRFSNIFAFKDQDKILQSPASLEHVLSSIFDVESRAFVAAKDESTQNILRGLNEQNKLCLFLQGAAGMAMVFQHISLSGAAMSEAALERELEVFAEEDERHEMLDKIAASPLLTTSCLDKSELAKFLMRIVEDEDDDDVAIEEKKQPPTVAWTTPAHEKIVGDVEDWYAGERPCKNMGLPWGFTILALN